MPKPPLQTLDVVTLAALIAANAFSISTDETRLHLEAALFEWDNDRVRMSHDGHRLSKLEVVVKGKHESATCYPLKGVPRAAQGCARKRSPRAKTARRLRDQNVQSGPNAFFEMAGFSFIVKLVDAQFPPYQQVIPRLPSAPCGRSGPR